MKKCILLISLLIIGNCVFGNQLYSRYFADVQVSKGYWYPITIDFTSSSYLLDFDHASEIDSLNISKEKIREDDYYCEKGQWKIENEYGLDYLFLTPRTGESCLSKSGILNYGKHLFLSKGNKIFINSFFHDREPKEWPFMNEYTVSTSSFLRENGLSYYASNFYYDKYTLKPWVEGKKDEGKGEWVEFHFRNTHDPWYPNCIIDSFLFSNGYVNYDKPYLYKDNNRVKKMRVVCEEKDIDFVVELEDTCQFQLISLPKELGVGECTIRFYIEDVYKGEKYNDTCINKIFPICKSVI